MDTDMDMNIYMGIDMNIYMDIDIDIYIDMATCGKQPSEGKNKCKKNT